ncbi:MAG: bifunctional phosphopantothenoylcysteine decarboxylase/phosphopantothenate--cysteine ligase CoaBC [Candidatus Limiplasma sp.]|nr:bifunctional phosphopantothenoylcysteine decarboxylase/phosphopantothenate--cysteine ligase CoaBC [Candidatus Limiplasma sp.]
MSANIVMGVTGGIAAYKAAEVVSALHKRGMNVDVILTRNATQFVTPLTFEALSHNPVTTDTFVREQSWEIGHVALAQKADLVLVAPATANLMAKLAHGIADDMLTTTLLATKAPILLAPAMNTGMWTAEATCQNLRTLLARGVRTVGPGSGLLACGDVGEGRMSEPAEIVEAVEQLLHRRNDLSGLRVLVTAGPTREHLDPVRYLSNESSGKMGYALAEAALARGATVTLVTGPTALTPPAQAQTVSVETTQQLYQAVLERCEAQDVILQAAAPADYRFETVSPQKLKKQDGEPLTLRLTENPDIAKAVAAHRQPGQTLVGFAAETSDTLQNARRKLEAKGLDLIVANDVTLEGAGFNTDTNIATLLTREQELPCPLQSKRELADRILDMVLSLHAGV